MLSHQDLLEVGLSPDAETLQARLAAAAGSLGFGLSSATLIRGRLSSGKAKVRAVFNTPADFLEASRSTEFGMADPFLNAVLSGPGCYTYDEAFYRRAGADKLWGLISSFGYRHGMAISIHEPGHAEMFSFGIDGPDALPSDPDARFDLQTELQLLALHAHGAAKRLWTEQAAVDLGSITPREVEALRWAMDGISVWATHGRLVHENPGLARDQKSAVRKLGAKTGAQAVLKALDGKLIER